MKKTNYLKGLGAKLALAVVAFGAAFTSCTEEDFNINVQPNNAKVIFNPTAIDPVSVATVNATFTGAEAIEGNPSIAAGSRTITATANGGATGSATVNYEAVQAGSTVTYSPVIILSDGLFTFTETASKIVSSVTKNGNVDNGHSHNGSSWFLNASDYSGKFTAEWNESAKTSVKNVVINNAKAESYIDALIQTVNAKGSETYEVAAWEMISTIFTISTSETTYNIVSTVDGTVVGQVTVVNPLAKVEIKEVRSAIPGHESHYHYGHSHGAGDNAGGGMGWAE
ncbi:MAG: DUF3869 domain-containing protein [Bacteroides sp.]|nr:DUF3869 domain-containing protein [Bacteroides sp.]